MEVSHPPPPGEREEGRGACNTRTSKNPNPELRHLTQNKNQHGTRSFDWSGKSVLVTGGASFIGSHDVHRLVERGARHVPVGDDLSSGTVGNIQGHIDSGVRELVRADLLAPGATAKACLGI